MAETARRGEASGAAGQARDAQRLEPAGAFAPGTPENLIPNGRPRLRGEASSYHAAISCGMLNLWMKSAAFCACAAAVNIARLSPFMTSSQFAR